MYLRISIALISASALAYEILLMRLLSIVQWHHFAYMIISLALLGFGASGTFLTIARRWLLRHFAASYIFFAVLFGITSTACFALAQLVPFNAFEIIWDTREPMMLALMYCILFIPFFFAASSIGIAFMRFRDQIGGIYLFDLLGAGLGAIAITALLRLTPPTLCLGVISALAIASAGLATLDRTLGRRKRLAELLSVAAIAIVVLWSASPLRLRPSEYKGLSKALLLPGAEVIREESHPLGFVTVVESSKVPFRHAPGMSPLSKVEIPKQLGLFIDADSLTAITEFSGSRTETDFFNSFTQALPYELIESPDVLVLGSGGGADVLAAISEGARTVDAVELNPAVADLVTNTYSPLLGNIFDMEGITQFVDEARGFVQQSDRRYDIVELSLVDSFSASSAGLYALSESYLYTTEALEKYLGVLKPNGYLSITRWLRIPPRDTLKLFATAVDALSNLGVNDPGKRLALIRGWKTATLLIKNGEITGDEIGRIKKFSVDRAFDTAYYPGIERKATNRFNVLEKAHLYEGAIALLGDSREDFVERYKFDIIPATDNRPYFFNFFKWSTLPEILRLKGAGGAALMEWGYPILIATLVQAVVLSLVLIALPLRSIGSIGTRRGTRFCVVAYFSLLGLAFLFLEIAFIQKFILLLSHPTYAIAVILSSFLIFAGLGSGISHAVLRRHEDGFDFSGSRTILIATIVIAAISICYVFALPPLIDALIGLGNAAKIVISVALIAPLAFFMGMPFPIGLKLAGRIEPGLVPWGFGINGCASVVSPIIATILAIHLGFSAVVVCAAVMYLIAPACMWGLRRSG